MQGQYEFETVCSAGMMAMETRPEKKYRLLTAQETIAVVQKQKTAKGAAEEDICAICQMPLIELGQTSQKTGSGRGGGGGDDRSDGNKGAGGDGKVEADDEDGVGDGAIQKVAPSAVSSLARSLNCDHVLHAECMERLIESKSSASTVCPECRTPYASGVRFGSSPRGTMVVHHVGTSLPGFPKEGTIRMEVHFSSGIQGPRHPTPGARYVAHGFPRSFFMPESQAALAFRLQLAFYWRVIFKVGTSQTTHEPDSVIWTGAVPVKSDSEPGQTRSFSDVPQENRDYCERLSRDLDAVGITAAFAELSRRHLRTPLV
jgi:deltex-like protein